MVPVLAFVLAKSQAAANVASGDPQGVSNHRLTMANYVWIVIGILLYAMVILGYGMIALGLDEVAVQSSGGRRILDGHPSRVSGDGWGMRNRVSVALPRE